MIRRNTRVIPLLVLLTVLTACAKKVTVTNVPTGVNATSVQNWDSAVKDFTAISTVVKAASDTTIQLADQGIIPKEYAVVLLGAEIKIAQAGQDGVTYLKTVPNNWGQPVQQQVANYINAVTAAVNQATSQGLVGIKDPASQQKVSSLLNQIKGLTQTIQGLVALIAPTARNWIQKLPDCSMLTVEVACG